MTMHLKLLHQQSGNFMRENKQIDWTNLDFSCIFDNVTHDTNFDRLVLKFSSKMISWTINLNFAHLVVWKASSSQFSAFKTTDSPSSSNPRIGYSVPIESDRQITLHDINYNRFYPNNFKGSWLNDLEIIYLDSE